MPAKNHAELVIASQILAAEFPDLVKRPGIRLHAGTQTGYYDDLAFWKRVGTCGQDFLPLAGMKPANKIQPIYEAACFMASLASQHFKVFFQ